MRRGRIFIFIALILIIGLAVLAFVFRQVLLPAAQPDEPVLSTAKVYIAGQNIPQGEIVTEEVLATIDIPQDNVISVMYTTDQKNALIGKIAKYPIEQGVVITSSMVSDGDLAASGPSWASQIPQGMTAIAIPTNRLESVAYGIRDGAHVDVSACFLFVDIDPSYQSILPNDVSVLGAPGGPGGEEGGPIGVTLSVTGVEDAVQGRTEVESAFQQGIYVVPSEPQRPRLVCQMILQNAIVMKLGGFPFEAQPTSPDEEPDPEAQAAAQAQSAPDIATLIVLPQDSITLSYLMYSGAKITMTLRNASDDSRVATEATTLQFLLSQYNIPVPAKLPYAMEKELDAPSSSSSTEAPPPTE